jgi:hypothetical protein
MKTQLSIQMRIVGLKDLKPSPAQPRYALLFGSARLSSSVLADLIPEHRQITQPTSALAGNRHQATDNLYQVCLLAFSQGLQLIV